MSFLDSLKTKAKSNPKRILFPEGNDPRILQAALIPRGFAHGYLVLSDFAEVMYKVDNVYAKDSEGGLRYDDPSLGIAWPDIDMEPKVNERDRNWPLLA